MQLNASNTNNRMRRLKIIENKENGFKLSKNINKAIL